MSRPKAVAASSSTPRAFETTTNAVAGPSSQPYFPIPFRLDTSRSVPSTPARLLHRVSQPSSFSRSSTPSHITPRARSTSTFSTRTQVDEDATLLQRKRADSVKKMVNTWDLLAEKYGSIGIHDDDEIDILTSDIITNRGRLKTMKAHKDIGLEMYEDEDETITEVMSETGEEESLSDSDDDVFASWDVDMQTGPKRPQRVWTDQDQDDLEEFMKKEKERKAMELDTDEDADGEDGWSSEDQESCRSASPSPVLDSGSILALLKAEDEESEDELLKFDPDAQRNTPVPLRKRQVSLCFELSISSKLILTRLSHKSSSLYTPYMIWEAGPSRLCHQY